MADGSGIQQTGDVNDLRQVVGDYVQAVRRRPELGSDPAELAALEKASLLSLDGAFGAQVAPIADDTWEARTLYLGSSATSERIQIDIPYPVIIVGTYASLSTLTSGGGTAATVDDIDVSIDLNTKEYRTSVNGTVTTTVGAAQQRDGTFVTLGSVSTRNTNGLRLMAWKIPYRSAQLGVIFRWKQGTGVFHDAHVGLAFFARRLDKDVRI